MMTMTAVKMKPLAQPTLIHNTIGGSPFALDESEFSPKVNQRINASLEIDFEDFHNTESDLPLFRPVHLIFPTAAFHWTQNMKYNFGSLK